MQIDDLKTYSLEEVSQMYRLGQISEDLTQEYIELWNRGPHYTRAQLTGGVIRNYLRNDETGGMGEDLRDFTRSYWLKARLLEIGHRDIVDMYNDVCVLKEELERRLQALEI